MRTAVILGSTGSIGRQTLAACKRLGIGTAALTAKENAALLEEQARAFSPRFVALEDESRYKTLKRLLADTSVQVLAGREGLAAAAETPCDVVCNGIVGSAGLEPTLWALGQGRTVALSNKESLVAGGALVYKTLREKGGTLLPVDSEHSAIFQCLQGNDRRDLRRVWLTASGGPFFGKSKAELLKVTPEAALRHPNWSMGSKITVDSATLMNKGLEFMEAMWLFQLTPQEIQVVIHPQSVLHSAVEYKDGSLVGQMGTPDMAVPIQYALTYPRRQETMGRPLSLLECAELTFYPPDMETFTCLSAALEAARLGGLAPCVVNGANEEAVAQFLGKRIGFCAIGEMVWTALENVSTKGKDPVNLADILETDAAAREMVRKLSSQS